jgi:hypothetical protein
LEYYCIGFSPLTLCSNSKHSIILWNELLALSNAKSAPEISLLQQTTRFTTSTTNVAMW